MEVNLIDLYIDDLIHQGVAEEAAQERKNRVLFKALKLKYIKQELEQEKLLQEKMITKRSQLYHILGENEMTGLSLNVENIKNIAQVGELIFSAYELTSEILQELGIIDPVSYTVTYRTKTNFMRTHNFTIDPQKDLEYEIHRGALVIRLKSASIRHKLVARQTRLERQWVNVHYQAFVYPLKEAQKKAKNWKINWGVASEAFERHWEELSHSIDKPVYKSDFGGEGRIWKLYKESSGSDAYYTGPDTALAQVKNANASIISNADTVLNTIEAVLKLVSQKAISNQAAIELKNSYAKAFKQKKPEKESISKDIWDAVDKTVQDDIIKAFGASQAILKEKEGIVIFI